MKVKFQIVILFPILLISFIKAASQDLDLKNLKTPNSPGFQILDISPSSIERPTNPKAFALSMFNLTSNGTAIPKNFAFEFSPYWYTKPTDATVYKYLNIHDGKHVNMFTGIYNKLGVSMVSSYSDSTAGSLLKKTNYVSIGIRTNIVTVRTKKQNADLSEALSKISSRMQHLKEDVKKQKSNLKGILVQLMSDFDREANGIKKAAINSQIDLVKAKIDELDNTSTEELEKKINADETTQENLKKLDAIPLFQLDAAYAYSEAMPGNTYDQKRFNRSGFWMNATLSGFSFNQSGLEDNLSITIAIRFLNDNVLSDTLGNIFQRKNCVDIGGRFEYKIKQFSISIEFLKRKYSSNSSINSQRTVGILQYKVNDNLYLTGTYGKNFGNLKNLFTMLGINWGFGKTSFNPDLEK